MTRKSKIKYLIPRGEQIVYHFRSTDGRLTIDSIWTDGHWENYGTCTADQVKAGQLIDLLYWNWTKEE